MLDDQNRYQIWYLASTPFPNKEINNLIFLIDLANVHDKFNLKFDFLN